MAAPSFIAYAKSGDDVSPNPHVTASFTWLTDDFFVIIGGTESNGTTLGTPTTGGSGLTFAALGSPVATDCWAHAWTGTASGNGNGTIESTASPALGAVLHVWQFRTHGGIGNNNRAANVTGSPATVSVTVAEESAVCVAEFDFNAAAAGVAGSPTTTPTPTERSDSQVSGRYSHSAYDHIGVTAGTRGYGLVNVTGRDSTMVAVEVLGSAAATIEQEGFRWRNDNGSETTATWRQTQDTNDTATLDEQVRLRALLNSTGDPASTQYQLEYKEDSEAAGLWRPIGVGVPLPVTPSLRAAGALFAANSGTNITAVIDGSTVTNDVMILAVMANAGTTFSTPTDWTQFGTLINSANQSTNWFWKRHDGSEANPSSTTSVTGSTTIGLYGRVYSYKDCITTGTPFEDATNAGTPTTDTVPQSAAIDTTDVNRLAVCFVSCDDDNTWSSGNPPATWSIDGARVSSTVGGDCFMSSISKAIPAAAAVGAETVGTMSAADYWRTLTLALIPPALATPGVTYATSSQYADGDATTFQLSAPAGKATSDFDAGVMVEGQALADAVDITADDYTEIEWALKAQTPAVNTDVYQFRVTANGTPLTTYTVTPDLTIAAAAAAGPPLRRRRPALLYR